MHPLMSIPAMQNSQYSAVACMGAVTGAQTQSHSILCTPAMQDRVKRGVQERGVHLLGGLPALTPGPPVGGFKNRAGEGCGGASAA